MTPFWNYPAATSLRLTPLFWPISCSKLSLEPFITSSANTQSWTEQRRKISAEVLAKADAEITARRAEELSEYNKQDLQIAKALRAQIARHIQNSINGQTLLTPRELKILASAQAEAQKIGRLALGVSTSNNEHTGANGLPFVPILDIHFVD